MCLFFFQIVIPILLTFFQFYNFLDFQQVFGTGKNKSSYGR